VEAVADALAELDAGAEDVIRTRMYAGRRGLARGRAGAGGGVRGSQPSTTLVEVEGFVDEVLLVEVEAEAVATG
jgi:hypothetical protein